MSAHLRHDHELLLNSLREGKLPRNLSWDEVVDLIGQIGEVLPHGNNEFTFIVGAQRQLFKRPHTHDLDVEEVSRLRRFLRSDAKDHDASDTTPSTAAGRVVVVIDHHGAHIYKDVGGSVPVPEDKITPYDPHGFQHHLIHRKEAHYRGERVPEESSFYEQVAKDLAPAREIILIGHATGTSSAVDYLAEYLKDHHPETFARVFATEKADLSALTAPEIEAIAKKHLRG
jgi:hypothetical protein